jgi:hypothetical protein
VVAGIAGARMKLEHDRAGVTILNVAEASVNWRAFARVDVAVAGLVDYF